MPGDTAKKKARSGAGTVRQRGEDSWQIRARGGIDPATGKHKQIARTVHGGKKQAQQALVKLQRELADGLVASAPAGMTFGDLLTDWLAHVKNTTKPNTWINYRTVIKKHLRSALGAAKLINIAPLDLQNLLAQKLDEGLAPRTVNLIRFVARAALGFAVDMQLLARNPGDAVKPVKNERKEMRAWTPEEARRFLDAAKDERLYALYALALDTGARRGEILGLRWQDVDLDGGLINIQHSLTQRRTLERPKTQRSIRTVDISARTVEALWAWRKRQLAERILLGSEWTETGFVFTSQVGTAILPDNLDRNYQPIMRRAGVPVIRFHDIRHTVATLLLAASENPRVVSERLGHSNVAFTLQTYAHVLPGQQKAAAEKLSDLLFQ